MQSLEIRDPIHGFIYRDTHEQKIIDTAVFQRLRRIKQLALASLVYPGAIHTRFDHSLGAFHIASKLADRLLGSNNERRLVRLAALLHDIGHGPFSHVSEEVLEKFVSRTTFNLQPSQQVHEVLTGKIILSDPGLERLLSLEEREEIINLLSGSKGDTLLKSILSGPVDVDKQDYLLRDSHFCGVKYGVYDLEQLTETLRVHEDGEDRYLALASDGVHALEQFVLARYYMTTQIYRHRIRLITDEMIIRAISLGIEKDNISWLRDLYTYNSSDEYLKEYLRWDDERLATSILASATADGYAKDLFHRLQSRKLLKRIFTGLPADFDMPEIRAQVFEGRKDFLGAIESKIASVYQFDPCYVVAKLIRVKSVRAQATTTEGQVIVLHPDGPRPFEEESTLFRSINAAIQEQFFEIYAPVEYTDQKDKKKKRREFHREIIEMIRELANPQGKLFEASPTGGNNQ